MTFAGHGSRSPDRTDGDRGRARGEADRKAIQRIAFPPNRAGRIDLEIPKPRKGIRLPSFPQPRRTAEKALVTVIREAYVKGISTRSVDDPIEAMGGSGLSQSSGTAAWSRRSTSGSTPSPPARSKANGPVCGAMRPT